MAVTKNPKLLVSKSSDLPEIKKLYEAIQEGINFICFKLKNIQEDTDPNDVVNWITKSGTMAESLVTFYNILNDVSDDDVTIRGGASIGQFEDPKRNT